MWDGVTRGGVDILLRPPKVLMRVSDIYTQYTTKVVGEGGSMTAGAVIDLSSWQNPDGDCPFITSDKFEVKGEIKYYNKLCGYSFGKLFTKSTTGETRVPEWKGKTIPEVLKLMAGKKFQFVTTTTEKSWDYGTEIPFLLLKQS